MMTIRGVEPHEWPTAFAACGQRFFDERRLPGTFDLQRAVMVWSALNQAMPAVLIVACAEGQIVGGIGALIMQDEYSEHRFGAEVFWYVQREHRHGTAGLRCLKAAEAWASSYGITDFRLGEFRVDGLPGSNQHYLRMGYVPFYTVYRKEL